jgi:ABC-type transporter Mla subunit MlaD
MVHRGSPPLTPNPLFGNLEAWTEGLDLDRKRALKPAQTDLPGEGQELRTKIGGLKRLGFSGA